MYPTKEFLLASDVVFTLILAITEAQLLCHRSFMVVKSFNYDKLWRLKLDLIAPFLASVFGLNSQPLCLKT
jgi:hypothetical protein